MIDATLPRMRYAMVGGGHGAFIPKDGAQARKLLERRFGTRAFITIDDLLLSGPADFHRNDFGGE